MTNSLYENRTKAISGVIGAVAGYWLVSQSRKNKYKTWKKIAGGIIGTTLGVEIAKTIINHKKKEEKKSKVLPVIEKKEVQSILKTKNLKNSRTADFVIVHTWLYEAAKFIRENARTAAEKKLSKKLDEMLNSKKIQFDDVKSRFETVHHSRHEDSVSAFFDPFFYTNTKIQRKIIVIDIEMTLKTGFLEFLDTITHEVWHACQCDMEMININDSNQLTFYPNQYTVEKDAYNMGFAMYNKYIIKNNLNIELKGFIE